MPSSKDLLLSALIVGAFVLVFALTWLPGIVTHDAISHEFGGDSIMFTKDGGIKDSFWSWDSLIKDDPRFGGGDSKPLYQPGPVTEGDLTANPFAQ